MNHSRNIIFSVLFGGLFMFCGFVWVISNLAGWDFDFNYVWPLFVLIPGLFFWAIYFSGGRKDWGLLIPATILTITALTFYFNIIIANLLNYGQIWALTAFAYPGSVAVAFWVAWAASGRKMGMNIAASILSMITFFTLCLTSLVVLLGDTVFGRSGGRLFWPMALICTGVFILISPLTFIMFGHDKDKWDDFGKSMEKMGKEMGEQIEKAFGAKDGVEEGEIVPGPTEKPDSDLT